MPATTGVSSVDHSRMTRPERRTVSQQEESSGRKGLSPNKPQSTNPPPAPKPEEEKK